MSVPSGYSNHRGWRSRGRNGLGILPLNLEPYRAVPSWAMRFIRDCLYGVIILLLFARPVKSEPLLGLGCPESTVSRCGSRPGPLQPRGLALEKQMFNVSFSKCFPEFRKPPETSGPTGEKLLSWVRIHQCWLVSDPPDLATMWPDLVIGMGFGGGVFTSPSATPGQAWHGASCFVGFLQHGGSSLFSATAVPPGVPTGRQVLPVQVAGRLSCKVAVGHTEFLVSVRLPSSSVWASRTRMCCVHPRRKTPLGLLEGPPGWAALWISRYPSRMCQGRERVWVSALPSLRFSSLWFIVISD